MKTAILFFLACVLMSSCKELTPQKEIITAVRDSSARPITATRKKDITTYITTDALVAYLKQAQPIIKPRNLKPPFNDLRFNKVIIYDYKGSEEPYNSVIDEGGNFAPVIMKQQALTEEQILELTDILTNNSTYGGGTAACFMPHMGIVFYDGDQKVSAIDICLGCNYLISDETIPATSYHKIKSGDETFPAIGFSDNGKENIQKFCKKFNFYYGKETRAR